MPGITNQHKLFHRYHYFEAKGEKIRIEWSSVFDTEEIPEAVINVFNARERQVQNFERLKRYLEQLN